MAKDFDPGKPLGINVQTVWRKGKRIGAAFLNVGDHKVLASVALAPAAEFQSHRSLPARIPPSQQAKN